MTNLMLVRSHTLSKVIVLDNILYIFVARVHNGELRHRRGKHSHKHFHIHHGGGAGGKHHRSRTVPGEDGLNGERRNSKVTVISDCHLCSVDYGYVSDKPATFQQSSKQRSSIVNAQQQLHECRIR